MLRGRAAFFRLSSLGPARHVLIPASSREFSVRGTGFRRWPFLRPAGALRSDAPAFHRVGPRPREPTAADWARRASTIAIVPAHSSIAPWRSSEAIGALKCDASAVQGHPAFLPLLGLKSGAQLPLSPVRVGQSDKPC